MKVDGGYELQCIRCGAKFISPHWVRTFCSEDCRRRTLEEQIKRKSRLERDKRRAVRENKREQEMPTLSQMTGDELLHYGRTQSQFFLKRGG